MKNLSLPSICTNTFFRNHIAAFFALISLCLVFNTSAQDKVPAVYIGSIPDQIHYFDPAAPKAFQLEIRSSLLTSPAFSLENAPVGCTISANGLFKYIPAATSNTTIEVNVKATANELFETQSFLILPTMKIPDDVKCFNTVSSSFPAPDTESKDYILVTESKSDVEEFFNTTNRKPRTATVSGLTIVIQKGHDNGIYEKFCSYKEGQTDLNVDLKKLTIAAEKIIVRSNASFPKTNLLLFAKELVFENGAVIDTTPLPFSIRAADCTPTAEAQKGHDGETGGNISLFVSSITPSSSGKTLFSSLGSAGQEGGRGANGMDGESRDTMAKNSTNKVWDWPSKPYVYAYASNPFLRANLNGLKYGIYLVVPENGPYYVAIDKYLKEHTTAALFKPGIGGWKACGAVNDKFEFEKWQPGNGTKARNAGAGGHGGVGGNIESSYPSINSIVGLSGGAAGAVQTPLPKGGACGNPNPAFAMEGGTESGFFLGNCVFFYKGTKLSRRLGRRAPAYYDDYSNITGIHESTPGADSDVPSPANPGKSGQKYMLNKAKTMAWIHPLSAAQAMKYIKAACLNGKIDYAKTLADRWAGYTQKAIEEDVWFQYYSPSFDTELKKREEQKLENQAKTEITQQSGEFQSVLSNIGNGLDYYGNPAGWTPMISFELSIVAFSQQIDHSIDTMYLTYWLKKTSANNQSKLAGLWRLRNKTGEKVKESLNKLEELDKIMPQLQREANDTDNLEAQTRSSLAALNSELQRQAAETVKNKRILSTVFKVLGTICSIIPVGQPMLGQIGGTLGDVVSSAVNGDAAGAVTAGLGGLGKAFNKAGVKGWNSSLVSKFKSGEIKKYYSNGPEQGDDNWIAWENKYRDKDPIGEHLNGIATAGGGLANSIKSLASATGQNAVSDPEVQAEIKKLQEQTPEFRELGDKVAKLVEKKKDVAAQIAQACASVAFYTNQMTASLNAIDSIQNQVLLRQGAIDPRLDSYLDELSKRAEDNLIKYHYYMKKAYEYRMLKEYTTPLDLSDLKNSIIKLVEVDNAGSTLNEGQFKQLKTLYSDVIWKMCAQLYDEIINMRKSSESDTETTYEFHPNQLDALNRGETLEINFQKTGLFGSEQGLRIRSIEVTEMNVGLAPWAPSTKNANFSVFFTHDGVSDLSTAKGNAYRFRHYNSTSGDNKIVWGGKYTYTTKSITQIVPSVAEASLLKTILTDKKLAVTDAEMPIFCWPSANATINIKKSMENKESKSLRGEGSGRTAMKGAPSDSEDSFSIKSLKVNIKYSMLKQDSSISELIVKSDEGISPTILFDKIDQNGYGSGRAPFSRIFKTGETVTVSAPAQFGSAKFAKWTDSQGDSSGFIDPTNPVLSALPIKTNRTIVARYSYDISGNILGLTDGQGNKTSGAAIAVIGEKFSRLVYMEDKELGMYKITGLRPGKYTLVPSFNKKTFTPVSRELEIVDKDISGVDFNTTSSENAKNLAFGKIRSKNGASWEPFGGAMVTLVKNDKSGYKRVTFTSERDGTFQFDALDTGNYTITPSYSAYQFESSKDKDKSYTFDLTSSMGYDKYPNLIFNADPVSVFAAKGQVTQSDADGVKITVKSPNGADQSAMTDKDGKFSFMLTPATYTFTPSKTGFVFDPVSISKKMTNKDIEDVNFTIKKSATNTFINITGRVEDLPASKTAIVRLHMRSGVLGMVQTDANGNFKFTRVPQDKYVVAPSFDGFKFRPGTKEVNDATDVELVFHARQIVPRDDFDGDGKSDSLWTADDGRHFASGSDSLKGSEMGSLLLDPVAPCQIIGSGDFDGDGASEVISRSGADSGPFWIYSPLTGKKRLLWHGLDKSVMVVATGDFDGDGTSEIVWFNSQNCEIRIDRGIVGWDMAPKGQRLALKNFEFIQSSDSDGDGRDEVIFKDTSSDLLYRAKFSGSRITGFDQIKDK